MPSHRRRPMAIVMNQGDACLQSTAKSHAWANGGGRNFVTEFKLGPDLTRLLNSDGEAYITLTFGAAVRIERMTTFGVECEPVSATGLAATVGSHVSNAEVAGAQVPTIGEGARPLQRLDLVLQIPPLVRELDAPSTRLELQRAQ